jgi:hypothetical protein
MNGKLIFSDGGVCTTDCEYEIGEVITVNSTRLERCVRKELLDGELRQYFAHYGYRG